MDNEGNSTLFDAPIIPSGSTSHTVSFGKPFEYVYYVYKGTDEVIKIVAQLLMLLR